MRLLNLTQTYPDLKYDNKDLTTGFWFCFLETFLLVFITEIADKSFVLLIFYSLKNNEGVVFFTSLVFLCMMNVLAVLLGTAIPILFYPNFIEWLAVLLFVLYSIKLFETALGLEQLAIYEVYIKFDDKQRIINQNSLKKNKGYLISEKHTPLLSQEEEFNGVHEIFVNDKSDVKEFGGKIENLDYNETTDKNEKYGEKLDKLSTINDSFLNTSGFNIEEETLMDKVCGLVSNLLIAECGDRSQVTTIIIASVYDFWGVMFGSLCAQLLSITIAVFLGSFLSKIITEKVVYFIEAGVFLIFFIQILVMKLGLIHI